MGGEDWKLWIEALKAADAIEDDAVTMAYSYIGPAITHPMYADGSIGKAKDDLFATAKQMTSDGTIKAYISVNKALVTQSRCAVSLTKSFTAAMSKQTTKTVFVWMTWKCRIIFRRR